MTNYTDQSTFDSPIQLADTTDLVQGGVNGTSNLATKKLANRTRFLKNIAASGNFFVNPTNNGTILAANAGGTWIWTDQFSNYSINLPYSGVIDGMCFHFVNASHWVSINSVLAPGTNGLLEKWLTPTWESKVLIRPGEKITCVWSDAWGGYFVSRSHRDIAPVGSFIFLPYWTNAANPQGYLKCNGAAPSRTLYADLFAQIGTTYGPGDGVTTFNIPDARGVFFRGLDEGRGLDPGRVLASYQADDFKSHNHGYIATYYSPNNPAAGLGNGTAWHTILANSEVAGGAETRPKNIPIYVGIKY